MLDGAKKPMLVKEKEVGTAKLTSPGLVADYANNALSLNCMAEEHLYIIAVNNKASVLGSMEISHGSVNESFANPREVFIRLLLLGASSFVMVHNHPSGEADPSVSDAKATKRIKESGDLLGIELLDHVIVAGDQHFSMREEGYF